MLITGYDNYWREDFEREWEPAVPAASVEKHNHRIGETAVQLLLDRIAGRLPAAPQCRTVPQEVVATT